MRCPKCHYISFGSVDRCRNCGYELSLAPEAKPLDLPVQDADDPVGPLGDFPLADKTASSPRAETEAAPVARRATSGNRLDLPLFQDRGGVAEDAPLVSAPAVPRQPLSVRRGVARGAGRSADGLAGDPRPAKRRGPVEEQPAQSDATGIVTASIAARLFAGIVDIIVLAGIDAAVFYATLRVLELSFADIRLLPPVPLGVFLVLLNGGYLSAFTAAGGQTIGKMLTGIKVVSAPTENDPEPVAFAAPVGLGSAAVRAAAYLVSLAPAGLGFLPVLFADDGRALHDRLANTRVIKA